MKVGRVRKLGGCEWKPRKAGMGRGFPDLEARAASLQYRRRKGRDDGERRGSRRVQYELERDGGRM